MRAPERSQCRILRVCPRGPTCLPTWRFTNKSRSHLRCLPCSRAVHEHTRQPRRPNGGTSSPRAPCQLTRSIETHTWDKAETAHVRICPKRNGCGVPCEVSIGAYRAVLKARRRAGLQSLACGQGAEARIPIDPNPLRRSRVAASRAARRPSVVRVCRLSHSLGTSLVPMTAGCAPTVEHHAVS